jgi:uncharacterized protein YoxC
MSSTQIVTEVFHYIIENSFVIMVTIFLIDYFVNKKYIYEKLKLRDEQSRELIRMVDNIESDIELRVESINTTISEIKEYNAIVRTHLEKQLTYLYGRLYEVEDCNANSILNLHKELSSVEKKLITRIDDGLNRCESFVDEYCGENSKLIDTLEQKVTELNLHKELSSVEKKLITRIDDGLNSCQSFAHEYCGENLKLIDTLEQKVTELNEKIKGLIEEQNTKICEFYVMMNIIINERGAFPHNLPKSIQLCFPNLNFHKYQNDNYRRIKKSIFPQIDESNY